MSVKTIAFVVLLLLAVNASAEFSALCNTANPCVVNGHAVVGQNSSVQLTWRGRVLFREPERIPGAGPAPDTHHVPVTVMSEGGMFTAAETSLGHSHQFLSTVVNPPAGGGEAPFQFNESLQVPAAVSHQAAAMGASQLQYVRSFHTSNGDTAAGLLMIELRQPPMMPPPPPSPEPEPEPEPDPGPAPGPEPEPVDPRTPMATSLQLAQVALRFESGALTRTLAVGEQAEVEAHLLYNRSGMFDAVWEVASPPSTRGQPVFVPVENVRQYLGAGGEARLRSPQLPVQQPGLYMIRLRVLQPAGTQAPVALHYVVTQQLSAEPEAVAQLRLAGPAAAAILDATTRFQWRGHSGAVAYQLEFYDEPPAQDSQRSELTHVMQQRAAGLLLPATTTETRLSAAVVGRLEADRLYYWRVVALDNDGAIMAASELRELHTGPP